jgi:hypothetical protein
MFRCVSKFTGTGVITVTVTDFAAGTTRTGPRTTKPNLHLFALGLAVATAPASSSPSGAAATTPPGGAGGSGGSSAGAEGLPAGSGGGSGLSSGAAAGIGVGVAVGALLFAALAWLFVRRIRRQRSYRDSRVVYHETEAVVPKYTSPPLPSHPSGGSSTLLSSSEAGTKPPVPPSELSG